MFAVVVTIFMVCWAPYHIYFIYSYHNPSITKMSYISHIYLGFYWLAMSNTCVNPIIYYWMNQRFRAYFDMILFCVPRVLKRATSGNWRSEHSLTRISRTQSCPPRRRQNDEFKDVSTIPVRAMGLKHSVSFGPDSYHPPSRHTSFRFTRRLRSWDSVKSRDSVLTQVNMSEELF